MLELADVHTYYGNIQALQGSRSTRRSRGEIVTLIGANGAGKTTTLRDDHRPACGRARGTVTFDGQAHRRAAPRDRIVRLGIAQSPEGRRIFPRMTVCENLELGAFARSDRDGDRRRPGARLHALPAPEGAPRRRAARCPAASSRCWPSAGR